MRSQQEMVVQDLSYQTWNLLPYDRYRGDDEPEDLELANGG